MKDLEVQLQEAAHNNYHYGSTSNVGSKMRAMYEEKKQSFVSGAMSEESKAFHTQGMYTEEEVRDLVVNAYRFGRSQQAYQTVRNLEYKETIDIWFETNKKK